MSGKHSEQGVGYVHIIHNFEYANLATREADTSLTSDDLNKIALQTDDNSFWLLTATTPTWVLVGGGGSGHTVSDAVTSALSAAATLKHNTSGTATYLFGTGLAFKGDSDSVADRNMGEVGFIWSTPGDANRAAQFVVRGYDSGNIATIMQIGVPANVTTEPNLYGIGRGAVDQQTYRDDEYQLATGSYSTIGGGRQNKVNGSHGFLGGGRQNHIASAGAYGAVIGGRGALLGTFGEVAHAASGTFGSGLNQWSIFHLGKAIIHNNTNWTPLDANIVTEVGSINVPTDSALTFTAHVTGATSGMGKSFGFKVVGMVENDGGTTTIKGTPTYTVIDDSDDVSFDCRVVANDTDDTLDIEVSDSDATGDTVRWNAVVIASQVIYA